MDTGHGRQIKPPRPALDPARGGIRASELRDLRIRGVAACTTPTAPAFRIGEAPDDPGPNEPIFECLIASAMPDSPRLITG